MCLGLQSEMSGGRKRQANFQLIWLRKPLDSEDPMFLLYTSGSTGKPKGLMHTTAGYLTGAAVTCKYALDLHKEDVYFCTGDLGWITGHTYSLYGPLLLGATVVIHEGTPGYPTFSRYWDIIDEHRVTHFYTAPTTLRLLRRAGDDLIRHKMAHLRLIACVGEPIAAEVWNWVYKSVGKEQAHIVDVCLASVSCCLPSHFFLQRILLYRHPLT